MTSTQQYNFEGVPDDVIEKILLELPYNDVISTCITHKRVANICKKKYFWARKALKDFNIPISKFYSKTSPPIKVYIQFYKLHRLSKIFMMIYDLAKDLRHGIDANTILQNITDVTHEQNRKILNILNAYQNLPQDLRNKFDTFKPVGYMWVIEIKEFMASAKGQIYFWSKIIHLPSNMNNC